MYRTCHFRRLVTLVVALLAIAGGGLRAAQPDAQGVEFFESKIRPLLVSKCYACHSAEAAERKALKGGLLLDSRAGVQAGGDTGPALVAGDVDASLLIKAVRYTDSDLKMPPKSRLTDAEIVLLEQWVKSGAPDPREGVAAPGPAVRTIDFETERKHWAYQPVVDPMPPAVRDEAWPLTPLDRFILAELEAVGLASPKPADKRTLLRRATFDLIGLPPTPAEIDAFLADDSPQAFARVVDRLLASPRYGERWGRHWLDVARYADSNGLDENIAHGNAWRYRDYVIAAINDDKPFDRFIVEQLAGDLLESSGESSADRRSHLIATGFLALGPKVLAEVDERKMELDIIDEQVDTMSRAFLGLTVGCARCHDHKFDPIPTRDYYSLAGIFQSTRTMEHFTKIARWWENPIPTAEEQAAKSTHDAKIAAAKAAIQARIEKANADLLAKLGAEAKLPEKPEAQYDDATKAEVKKLRDDLTVLEKTAPEQSTAMGVTEGKPADLKVHLRGSHLTLGEVAPRRFPRVFGETPVSIDAGHSGRLELARWIASPAHPLTARVIVNRAWRWHFGRGLVRTPDNFGKLGEAPTHPALLDWLATRFVAEGWSLKQLHRRIMLSRVYQASSDHNAEAARLDPENRLYSRGPVRRLEAEAIRDALLAVSGGLDLSMGGPAILHVRNREFLFDHTSKDGTTYDRPRRSVYLPVVRNHLYDFFELYDFPDSAVSLGDRPTTTVAPQALLALNSPLVWEAAGRLAEELTVNENEDSLRNVYLKVFGRLPSDSESQRCREFLDRAVSASGQVPARQMAARRKAWQVYCQSLLASNEFVYVR